MLSENRYCGMHITKCALIVAFIGFIFSCLSVISAIFLWFYIPSAIILALIFAYVMIGIMLEKPHFLFPALIVLSINIFINFFLFFSLLIVGSIAPNGLATTYANESDGDIEKARAVIRVAYFTSAVIVLISTAYNIFALSVIQKARMYLISSTTDNLPSTSSTATTLPFSFPIVSIPISIPSLIPSKVPPPPSYSEAASPPPPLYSEK